MEIYPKELFTKDAILYTALVNRVEVIDENGRSYVNWKPENNIAVSLHDEGKTLKIFITQNK